MSGDCGEVRHREGPAQALPLQVEVEQVLVSEHQSLGVLVLQVVHHVVCRVPPLVHVGKAVLPPPKVAYLPCSPNNPSHFQYGRDELVTCWSLAPHMTQMLPGRCSPTGSGLSLTTEEIDRL